MSRSIFVRLPGSMRRDALSGHSHGSRLAVAISGLSPRVQSEQPESGLDRKEAGFPTPPLGMTYAATATLILLGLASSRSGNRTVSTPALY